MRARKRVPPPLNFTPLVPSEDTPAREASRDTARPRDTGLPPKPPAPKSLSKPMLKSKIKPAAEPPPLEPTATPLSVSRNSVKRPPDLGIARHAYLVAGLTAVGWAGMLIAYEVGYVRGWNVLLRTPTHLAVLLSLALLPALFMVAAAFVARQGARLADEARWARSLADDLTTPVALTAARTGDILGAIREEVERANQAAQAAQDQLNAVRENLAAETERLTEAAAEAQRTARVMGETLAQERDGVTALLGELNAGAQGLSEGVERQTRLVAETSDLARSQLHEAEASLAASAASLTGASADAALAAQDAGETLARQAERLDVSAAALSERLRFLDARLTDQRNALSGLAQALEADEEEIAVRLESHRAQLMEAIAESRAGAGDLTRATDAGADALRALAETAVAQIGELTESVRANRALLASEAAAIRVETEDSLREALIALAGAAEEARNVAAAESEAVRETAEAHVAAARIQVEQLGQLAFDAGQRANQAFDSRIAEARRLIEQAAGLVEEAGLSSAGKIETGLGAARGALADLSGALSEIDAKVAQLPETAQRHADSVRGVVERSLSDMTAAARQASEETKALDAGFQERIRRNYESLSEAVKLMGRAGAPKAEAARPETARPEPKAEAKPAAKAEPAAPAGSEAAFSTGRWTAPVSPKAEPVFPQERKPHFAGGRPAQPVFGRALRADEDATSTARPAPEPALEREPAAAQAAAEEIPGLRPRLKLTPVASDEAVKAVFDAAPKGREAPGAAPSGRQWDGELDEWTWKDLLSSMDDGPTDTDSLAEAMIREIESLGVDAAALLPTVRVEQLAGAMLDGDVGTARDALRRLAPAAIRRLSRRVLTDKELREQADRFVSRYDTLLRDAAEHDDGVRMATGLLGSDAGRAFLLLDAAVGDL
jgi:hypothetical protein